MMMMMEDFEHLFHPPFSVFPCFFSFCLGLCPSPPPLYRVNMWLSPAYLHQRAQLRRGCMLTDIADPVVSETVQNCKANCASYDTVNASTSETPRFGLTALFLFSFLLLSFFLNLLFRFA